MIISVIFVRGRVVAGESSRVSQNQLVSTEFDLVTSWAELMGFGQWI